MKKFIAVSLITVLTALLIFVSLYGSSGDNPQTGDVDELNSRLHAIANEQQELKKELTDLSVRMKAEIGSVGTLSLLFTVLGDFVYDDAYPLLEENRFTASLGLAPDSLPSLSGCISRSEFDELLDKNWSTALVYDGETLLSQWLESMKNLTLQYNIDMPSAIYFPRNTYTYDFNDTLSDYGIKIIIHHGEEVLPIVSTNPGTDFFYVGSVGWKSVNAPAYLKRAVSQCGSVVFVAGSSLEAEEYTGKVFSSMTDSLSKYTLDGKLTVTDPEGMLESRLEIKESEELASGAYEEKAQEISRRIDELENQRRALVEKHIDKHEGSE